MKRGEIYRVDLGGAVGREPGGTRPVVVVSNDTFNETPVIVVVVIGEDATTASAKSGIVVPAADAGLSSDLVIFPNHIRTLDPGRFPQQPMGTIPPDILRKIDSLLKVLLDLREPDSTTSSRPA